MGRTGRSGPAWDLFPITEELMSRLLIWRTTRLVIHIAILNYGGVALLQWFHSALLGGVSQGGLDDLAHWVRDSTLALPFVALAVVLGHARARQGGLLGGRSETGVLFALIMGVGSVLHQTALPFLQLAHEDADLTRLPAGLHVLLIMLIAWAYATLVERGLVLFDEWLAHAIAHADHPRRWAPGIWVLVLGIAVLPPLLLVGQSVALMTPGLRNQLLPAFRAFGAAQPLAATSFPDQVIHPHGQLLLIARQLPDNTNAYIAPDYGDLGVRPIIEMTEGETPNFTLRNELSVDVSLHVHGVRYAAASDGTRHNNSFVRPGQEYVYQWRAAPGTAGYWHYHDHVFGDDEGTQGIAGGLYGGLVVRKAGAPKPVRTFLIVFHNFSINGRLYPDTPTPTA